MNLNSLFDIFEKAKEITGYTNFVIIGSLSIFGQKGNLPDDMVLSNDIDCYTKNDPGRIYDIIKDLGENSSYHKKNGFYLDAVSPKIASLPDGWENRLIKKEKNGIQLQFLDLNDAALSKYARGEMKDKRWIRAGILADLISLLIVKLRFKDTNFLDEKETEKVKKMIENDEHWFQVKEAQELPLHQAILWLEKIRK